MLRCLVLMTPRHGTLDQIQQTKWTQKSMKCGHWKQVAEQ